MRYCADVFRRVPAKLDDPGKGQMVPKPAPGFVSLEWRPFFGAGDDQGDATGKFSEKPLPDRARRDFDQ